MTDRRRLLVLATLILMGVSFGGVVAAGCHFFEAAMELHDRSLSGKDRRNAATIPAAEAIQPLVRAAWLATGTTLVIVIAGGTLLIRATNPFMRRLEESESRVRAILDNAGDGILTVDDRGIIQSFNLACHTMFRCAAGDAIGRPVGQLLSAGYNSETAVRFLAARAGVNGSGEAEFPSARSTDTEIVGTRADGSTFPLELCVSEFCWEEERVFTIIVRDTTQRNQAEAQTQHHVQMLRDAKEHLEAQALELSHANCELDEFTQIVSHDLKEPLRGISSYCQMLLEDYRDKLDEAGCCRLDALVALCRRLDGLIDDLLTYSQIGRAEPGQETVDLQWVVAEVLETLGPAIDRRGGRVSIEGRLPQVTADATLMGRVFRNLIANGLKFNDSVRPVVTISCLATDPPTLCVRDNGIGIPARNSEDIFTMFRRLHSRRKYDGSGAGLAFVRRIVEGHGGRVWVESEPGCGSTFYFTLATGANSAAEADDAPSAADASSRSPNSWRPRFAAHPGGPEPVEFADPDDGLACTAGPNPRSTFDDSTSGGG